MAEDIEEGSVEDVLRQALLCAFLEGGDCAFTAYSLQVNESDEKIDVGDIADSYATAALPHVMSALRAAQGVPATTEQSITKD